MCDERTNYETNPNTTINNMTTTQATKHQKIYSLSNTTSRTIEESGKILID